MATPTIKMLISHIRALEALADTRKARIEALELVVRAADKARDKEAFRCARCRVLLRVCMPYITDTLILEQIEDVLTNGKGRKKNGQ